MAVYFFAARKNMQKEEAVYSSMDAPEFPVVYTEFDGKEINALHGYIQDMGNQVAGESISVLLPYCSSIMTVTASTFWILLDIRISQRILIVP